MTRPGERYWQELEPIWRTVDLYHGPEPFLRRFAELPVNVGALYAAHWVQAEVTNGGFWQLFANSTGVLAPEGLAALHAMGLAELAAALAEAMALVGAPYPRDRSLRQAALAALPPAAVERLGALDEAFYAWLGAEPARWQRAADAFAAR